MYFIRTWRGRIFDGSSEVDRQTERTFFFDRVAFSIEQQQRSGFSFHFSLKSFNKTLQWFIELVNNIKWCKKINQHGNSPLNILLKKPFCTMRQLGTFLFILPSSKEIHPRLLGQESTTLTTGTSPLTCQISETLNKRRLDFRDSF